MKTDLSGLNWEEALAVVSSLDDEIAELKRENAALRSAVDTVQDERAASFARLGKAVGGISLTEYQPEVDLEIEEAIKALRADKERLDWLGNQVFSHRQEDGDWIAHEWTVDTCDENIDENDVRAAIDAARAALEATP